MNTVVVFPNSLFEDNKLITKNSDVYLVEHPVYFSLYKYHKMKLVMHRATMKYYGDYIKKKYKCRVTYITHDKYSTMIKKVFNTKNMLDTYDPVDHLVMKDIKSLSKRYNTETTVHNTPLFLSKLPDLIDYKNKHKSKNSHYNHSSFYIWQRKRFNILVTKDKKPVGGRWSFDKENRDKYPADFKDKGDLRNRKMNRYVTEAVRYVSKNFADNVGESDYYLPVTHSEAKRHLTKFCKTRFKCFGPYQDAVKSDVVFGCHSVISTLINVGLLTPKYVITTLVNYGTKNKVPIASVEGIIRQIIGWREYVRMLYSLDRKLFEKNHFKHTKRLKSYWFNRITNKNSGMPMIDMLINRTVDNGYLSHIERLMFTGNLMLITKTRPQDAYKWFMTMFTDSYNWVMYANVYGMSQHSSGPVMMNRPYFSSSSYIVRMSDYTKSKKKYDKIVLNGKEYEWFEVWDALYYSFIADNKTEFSKNYSLASQVKHWSKKSKKEQGELRKTAKLYLKLY